MQYVSLDLETTGLDPESDEIIEVAAIRFNTEGVIDRYHSLVNPERKLDYRIALLTGIDERELASAPHFGSIMLEIESFVGLDPIVGQNPTFDTGFLARKGLQLFGPTYDTHELAGLLLGGLAQNSLGGIADHLGLEFTGRHRAMADADAAMRVFMALRERLAASPPELLAEVERLSSMSDWTLRHLLREVAQEHPRRPGDSEREGYVHTFVKAPVAVAEPEPPATKKIIVASDEGARLLTSAAAREAQVQN
ncbi:MAG: 3'-5' exonuclease, partial [Chloroflexi bacterium]|nr:3'-5' exonuclease [Chloroflexota bacterium]